ncbi:MAG: MFS transporter [Candidatus Kariarchaeaceae archaeon]
MAKEVEKKETSNLEEETDLLNPHWKYVEVAIAQGIAFQISFQYTTLYARGLGASASQIGFMTASQNLANNLLQPIWGKLSDRKGRSFFLFTGFYLLAFSLALLSLATTPVQVIWLTILFGVSFSIILPSWYGAISDTTIRTTRGSFIGSLTFIANIFIVVISISFFFMRDYITISDLDTYSFIFLFGAINVLIASVVALTLKDRAIKENGKFNFRDYLKPFEDPKFKRYALVFLSWSFVMSTLWGLFPIYIKDVIDPTTGQIALASAGGAISQGLVARKSGSLIRRIGTKNALLLGFLPFAFLPIAYTFASNWTHLVFLQMYWGIAAGLAFIAQQNYLMDMAGKENTGIYTGSFQIMWGFVTFFGSLFGGLTLDMLINVYDMDVKEALVILLWCIGVGRIAVIGLFTRLHEV